MSDGIGQQTTYRPTNLSNEIETAMPKREQRLVASYRLWLINFVIS